MYTLSNSFNSTTQIKNEPNGDHIEEFKVETNPTNNVLLTEFFQETVSGTSLSLKGVDVILDHLQRKGSLKMKVSTVSGLLKLEEYINNLCNYPDGKYGVIFCRLPPHVTPITFTKRDNNCTIVITDSFGSCESSQAVSQFIFQHTGAPSYVYPAQRQVSRNDCKNISISDMVYISQDENFVNFVEENSQAIPNVEYMKELTKLPVKMHKITQNQQILCEEELNSLLGSKKSTKQQLTLRQSNALNSENNMNLLASKRFKKYEHIIINKFGQ